MVNKVFVADIKCLLPELFTTEEAIDAIYLKEIDNGRINRFAKRVSNSVGIKYRPSVLDRKAFPQKVLADPSYHPLSWGNEIVRNLLNDLQKEDVGFLSVSYNIRSDKDVLPSLASKISTENGLNLDYPPEEIPYLGCAASLFSIESAVKYCKNHNRAAIIFIFDQCSWIANPTYDMENPDFKENLKTTLLFADGAAGLLIIPESLKNRFELPLMEIDNIRTAFKAGGSLKMADGKLVLEENLKDIMPEIVRDMIIKPMNIDKNEISEWSLHQGGMPILMRFTEPEIFGLSEKQIARSKELFLKYGNFSSPSALFVLESFFNENQRAEKNETVKGAMISFGAGYFMGGMVYHWEK
ncbi:MAG TPA: hypothetical protein PKG52_05025 [bacterium]|nr:hypothetical protein [bacterium]HPS30651.1 hypothetical protein [bacterium]